MIDAAAMRKVCSEIHAVMAETVFGSAGVDALFAVLETLWELYRHVEPTRIQGTVIVFCPVAAGATQQGDLCGNLDHLSTVTSNVILEVRVDGTRYLHPGGAYVSAELAKAAVVYEYRNREESFLAGSERKEMIRFDPTADSQFAVPTFFTLREALNAYALEHVRFSGCPILNQAWDDPNRLFFKAAPEREMRRSLTQFLKSRLGASYEVRPEQVMDESHPVDIKVTYTPAKRLMIIEIKWLGDSRNDEGGIANQHRDARAKTGAKQLAQYLDQNTTQAPTHVTQGYYVIIDARRRGLREDTTTISKQDGLYYADKEIEFDPEYETLRSDFEKPSRMFAEPKYLD